MRQIRVTQYGGPEQMRLVELPVPVPVPVPAPDEALVRVTVAGVNYMDIAARSMPLPGWGLPAAMGVEGAGRVEAAYGPAGMGTYPPEADLVTAAQTLLR